MIGKQRRKPMGSRKEDEVSNPIKGVVVARKCKYCQHHEIGIKTRKGYVPLKPGMKVEVFEE